jgi:hypothetical protein
MDAENQADLLAGWKNNFGYALGSYGADIDKINELRKAGFFGKHCG